MNITKGIDNLLLHNNIDILRLILQESIVPTEVVIERAKKLYKEADEIWGTETIDFFCELNMINQELAQIFLNLLFKSTGINCHVFNILLIVTIKKMVHLGAIISSDADCLAKLPCVDLIEQTVSNGRAVDFELELNCIYFSTVDSLKWIRANSCEPDSVLNDLMVVALEHGKDKFMFYINEIKYDRDMLDKMIFMTSYLFRWDHIELSGHVINEELSFFIMLISFHYSLGNRTTFESFHPNIKKYINSNICQHLKNCTDEMHTLYLEVTRKQNYRNYALLYDGVMKKTRELLDYVDANGFDNVATNLYKIQQTID